MVFGFLFLYSIQASGQAANVWYFGSKAGIDFNNTPPAVIIGAMSTDEGCAVICDQNGKMLLYTDGTYIYNSTHSIVNSSTPLKGHASSTQSAIVVPKPGSLARFYIFTVDRRYSGCQNGINYSEVDVTGGNITLISANTKLLDCPLSTEKIAAAKHANGNDYWVTTFCGDGKFYSWLLTSSGVATTPVVSTVQAKPCITNNDDRVGYMKISPSGSYLVLGRRANSSESEAFTYNNSTGMVTQNLGVYHTGTVYGVEFSIDEKYFYATENFSRVVQYDWSFNRQVLHTAPGGNNSQRVGALQMGPDGNIYVANGYEGSNGPYLDRITDVNTWGATYENNFLAMAPGTASRLGLPTVVSSVFILLQISADKTLLCEGDSVHLKAKLQGGESSKYTVHWRDAGGMLIDSGFNIAVKPDTTTTYKAVLVQNGKTIGDTQTITITVSQTMGVRAGFTFTPGTGCAPLTVDFIDTSVNHDPTKSVFRTDNTEITGKTTFSYTYNNPGTYDVSLVAANSLGCKDSVIKPQIITVVEKPVAAFTYSPDKGCVPLTVDFENTSLYHDPAKSVFKTDNIEITGSTAFSHTYTNPGIYDVSLVVENALGCKDSIIKTQIITVDERPEAAFAYTPDKGCAPFTVQFTDTSLYHDTTKSVFITDNIEITGSSVFSHTYTNPGIYDVSLVVTNALGCKDTLLKPKIIIVVEPPIASFMRSPLGQKTGGEVKLYNQSSYATNYTWFFGDGDSLFQSQKNDTVHRYVDEGIYTITLVARNDLECTDTAKEAIEIYSDYYFFIPNAFTPSQQVDDTLNNVFGPVFGGVLTYRMLIFDRWGELLLDCENCRWDGRYKDTHVMDGVYLYIISAQGYDLRKYSYKGTFHLVR